jgi:hypothetical protein
MPGGGAHDGTMGATPPGTSRLDVRPHEGGRTGHRKKGSHRQGGELDELVTPVGLVVGLVLRLVVIDAVRLRTPTFTPGLETELTQFPAHEALDMDLAELLRFQVSPV